MSMLLKKRILSLFLAFSMVLPIVTVPSPVYASTRSEITPAKVEQLLSANDSSGSAIEVQGTPADSQSVEINSNGADDKFNFRILFTSDMHGSFSDYRYATLAAGAGLARVATEIESRRNSNTLLIDVGDTIQGNATSSFHSLKWDESPLNDINAYPLLAGMEYLKYDVWVMGNHEFNFGMDRLYKAYGKGESVTPTRTNDGSRGLTRGISGFNNLFSGAILGGNVFDTNNQDARVWDDFWVKKFDNGPNVAVIGMVHSDIMKWDAANVTAAGYRATTCAEETQKTIAYLKSPEAEAAYGKIDIFVGAQHISSGSGGNGAYGVINANPEIDLFLGAHGHTATNNTSTGVRYMELTANASSLGQVDITATQQADGSWKVGNRINDVRYEAISTSSATVNTNYRPLVEKAHQFAKANTEEVIGELTGGPLVNTSTIVRGISAGGTNAFYGFDNALTHLMHNSFRYYANGWLKRDAPELAKKHPEGVTLSASGPMNTSANKQPGPITRADIANLYTYDNNTLCVIELTGHQLKLLMEWSNGTGTKPASGTTADNFFHTGSISGTYDNMMFDGLMYKVVTSKPAWNRIVDMRNMDGTPFDMDGTYLLTANNHTTDSRFLNNGSSYAYSRLIALPDSQKVSNPNGGVYDLPVVHTRAAQEVLTVNGVDNNNAEGCTGVVGDYVERVLHGNLTNEFIPSWRFDSTAYPISDWVLYNKAIEIVNANIGVNYNQATSANIRSKLNPIVQSLWDTYAVNLDKIDNKNDYAAANWDAFDNAMRAAGQMILNSGTSSAPSATLTQDNVTAAVAAINTAVAALEPSVELPTVEINILSFNDFHGTVDSSASASNPGMARFTAVAKKLLNDLPNSTLVAAGDNYQGSAISNHFLGEPVSKMMKELGVKYSALGNHDFDWGPVVIPKFAEDAGIEFLAANIFLKGTNTRPDYCKPYATLEIGGKKIGLVGWAHTSTPTLVKAANVNDIEFRRNTDDNWFINEVDQWKAQEGWDAVIALTHDSLSGANLVGHIDAIILGHTHVTRTITINGIPAVEAYFNGRNIGRVKLEFEGDKLKTVSVSTYGTTSVTGTSILTPSTAIDEPMKAVYDDYYATVRPIFSEKVGVFGENIANRDQMAAWANQLVYDFIQRKTGENDYVLIQNNGGWREVATGRTPNEPVDYWFLNTLMPFDNEIYLFQLKGEYLVNFLNKTRVTGTGGLGSDPVITGAYKQGSDWYLSVNGEKIDPDKLYKVSMNDFMFTGGDNYGVVANTVQNPPLTQDYAVYDYSTLIMGVPLREALAQQLKFRAASVSDKTALYNLIQTANAKVQANFTAESWAAFAAALGTANTVYAKANATQTEVDDAKKTLQNAMDALVSVRADVLKLSVDSKTVRKGDYFNVYASFENAVNSNAAIITINYDASKFEYRGYTPAKGVMSVIVSNEPGVVSITVMIPDYNTKDYGQFQFSAKENAILRNELNPIVASVQYVVKDEEGNKTVKLAESSNSVFTGGNIGTGEGGKVTLIDLSNVIDLFGMDSSMPQWNEQYRTYDMNGDGKIDIQDIVIVAQMMQTSIETPANQTVKPGIAA